MNNYFFSEHFSSTHFSLNLCANCVQIKKQLHFLMCNCLIFKWEHTGSNRGPSACKADALNQLSYAPFFFVWDCKGRIHFRTSQTFSEIIS